MCRPNISGCQTSSDLKYFLNLHSHIVTRFCLFVLCVCLFVSDWNRQTCWGGWLRWGLELPSTQRLWRHMDSLTLLWTFKGVAEATGEARGQHSYSSQTMHCFAHSAERRESPQAAHMSQRVLHKPCCYPNIHAFFAQILLFPQKETHLQFIQYASYKRHNRIGLCSAHNINTSVTMYIYIM